MADIARTGVKPMTLELGGKSPQIVFADADLEKAAAAIATSVLSNAGQACVAGSRLLVERSVAEPLIGMILGHMRAVRPGPTWDEKTRYSPIISERQRARIHSIVSASLGGSVECLTGGASMDGDGYFYAPTLLAGVEQSSPPLWKKSSARS